MKKLTPYFLVTMAIIVLSACEKKTKNDIIGCDPVSSNIPFKVVDKSSGENLFFGEHPKYQISDLNVYKIKDKTRQNPIKLTIIGTGDQRIFLLPFEFSNPTDTMVVKVANTPEDILTYNFKKSQNPCVADQIEQPSFNNTALVKENNAFVFKKQTFPI